MGDPTDIINWHRLDRHLTTSGQPNETQLAAIARLGTTHVVNLALHTHEAALADEGASVAALGMTYIHIPVPFERPSEEDYRRFHAAMTAVGDKPVHVHCIMNYRVSAFLYLYRQQAQGLDEAAARSEMELIWRPGGVWAGFIGDEQAVARPHRIAGQDY